MTEHTRTTLQTYTYVYMHVRSYVHTQLCLCLCDPMTAVSQAPLSMELSRQEYWMGCHFLLQASFPTWESTALASGFFTTIYAYTSLYMHIYTHIFVYMHIYFCVDIYIYVYLYVYKSRLTHKYLHKPKSASQILSHSAAFCFT